MWARSVAPRQHSQHPRVAIDNSVTPRRGHRRTVGKSRQLKLVGGQLVAVDENQAARVERHRPSPRGANKMVLTDIH
jgi:hypothetical protein